MEHQNQCRTCMRFVRSSPAALTDEIYGFLAQDLGMNSVPKEHPELQLPQIVCSDCNSQIFGFQQFLTKCREVEEYFKLKLEFLSSQKNEYGKTIFVESIDLVPDEKIECTLDYGDIKLENVNDSGGDRGRDHDDPIFEIPILDIKTEDTKIEEKPTTTNPKIKTKRRTNCSVCGKSFRFSAKLAEHENIHKGIKPFSCDVCGKCFTQKSTLSTHLTLHFGKPVECKECGKMFSRKYELKTHNLLHRGEKPFVCDFENCKAKFRLRRQLSNHKAKHTGVRNFRCDICGHSFFHKSSMGTHMTSVHSAKYQCEICLSCFVSPNSIRNHISTKHDIQMDDVQHLRKIRSHRKRKNFVPAADKADSIEAGPTERNQDNF